MEGPNATVRNRKAPHGECLPVLVLGATGGQGGAVTAALLRVGRPVRALVRDLASPAAQQLAAAGAGLAAGEFTDREALVAAMRGTSAAFALTTPFESGTAAHLPGHPVDTLQFLGTAHIQP